MTTKKSKTFSGCSSAFRLMLATSWLAPGPWQDHQGRAMRSALRSGLDWDEYLTLVQRHRTPALSWESLKRVPEANIPTTVSETLQQRSAACRILATKLASLLMQLLKQFNQAGIPLIVLKGPLLSLDLYGDLGIRQSQDIDIMVALGDMSSAHAWLENMGWRAHLKPTFSPRHSEVFFKIHHHTTYWHPLHRCSLDLHWRTRWETPDRTATQWERSTASVWNGLHFQSLCKTDLALYLCEHGSYHAWFRSKWLGDLARIYAMDYVEWDSAYQDACGAGSENSLLQCLRLLKELHGLSVPETLRDAAERLPALLLDHVAVCMQARPAVHQLSILARFRMRARWPRYEGLLRPRRSWRQAFAEVAYNTYDFELLRLPDRFFWLYVPLRPFLLAWRWIRHAEPTQHREVKKHRR